MNTGNVLLGILAGAAVGATLGILYAPDKGSATRMKISQKSQDYADELSAKFDAIINELTAKIEHAGEEAKQLVENGKGKADELAANLTDRAR